MLFDEKFLIKPSPAFFAAFFRSPFFSLFFLGHLSSPSFDRFFTFFLGSYRSSRVLWRALFSKVSRFGVGEAEEEVDVPATDTTVLGFFLGRSDSSSSTGGSVLRSGLLGGCGIFLTGTWSKELSEDV